MDRLASLTIVDITILGTLFIAFLVGWTTGIIRFLTGFVSFLVALFIAGRYSHTVMDLLNKAWDLQGWMEGILSKRLNLPPEAAKAPVSQVPLETAMKWLSTLPVPDTYKQPLAQRLTEWSASGPGKTSAEFLIEQISAGILNALISAVMVIVIAAFLAYLGRFISESIQEIPLIGTADRVLGAVALVTETALILAFVAVFVVPLLSMAGATELGTAFSEAKTTPYLVGLFEKVKGLLFGGGTNWWSA